MKLFFLACQERVSLRLPTDSLSELAAVIEHGLVIAHATGMRDELLRRLGLGILIEPRQPRVPSGHRRTFVGR